MAETLRLKVKTREAARPRRLRGSEVPWLRDGAGDFRISKTATNVVYLGARYVFKVRRPVALPPFSDYRSAGARRSSIRREAVRGRLLLPALYLGHCRIQESGRRYYQPAVAMRRIGLGAPTVFDQLETGRFSSDRVALLAETFVELHRTMRTSPIPPMTVRYRSALYIEESVLLGAPLSPDSLSGLQRFCEFYERRRRERGFSGAARCLHGDLHSGNVLARGGDFAPIDVSDLSGAFGTGDLLIDLAFLWSDLFALLGLEKIPDTVRRRLSAVSDPDPETFDGFLGIALLNRANGFAGGCRGELAKHYHRCAEAVLKSWPGPVIREGA